MNAVLKPVEQEEITDLSVILTLVDKLPTDFYVNPAYEKALDEAINITTNLVYSLDDIGEKQAKSDATSINKFATSFKGFVLATFRQETDTVGKWQSNLTGKVKILLENRQRLIDQFAEKRSEKLTEIKSMLDANLKALWESMDIKEEFRKGDVSALVKFSAITAGGVLTKASLSAVKAIADSCLAEQNRIEMRHAVLENRCLRADINPPLTHVHLGSVFYADDSEFSAKVDELITAEINRKAESEALLRRKLEAENQAKIDAALKAQQDEANRIAIENAKQVETNDPAPSAPVEETAVKDRSEEIANLRKTADSMAECAQYADRSSDRSRELAEASKLRKKADEMEKEASSGLRTVLVTMVFKWDGVTANTSNSGVESFLTRKLPEPMRNRLKTVSSENA